MAKRSAVLAVLSTWLLALPLLAQFDTRPQGPTGPSGPNVVPEGSTFIVRLDSTLDTNKAQSGKRFNAKLAEDLVAPNGSIIPRGKKIKGHISESSEGMKGRLLLSFDEIETNHGSMPLIATLISVPGEHGVTTVGEEGEIEHKGPNTRRVVETAAVGAGVGAAAGAAAGGGRGAAIGAAAGGLVGGVGGALIGRDLKLQKGQQLELRLDRGLQVP